MASIEPGTDTNPTKDDGDVDVLVVGAGITGIYQLYRALEAGFSAQLLEAGDGVGGTWYWNRYPGARFDSESYTYGYLFSQELFDEWEWQEHFAGAARDRALPQPRGRPVRPPPPHALRRRGHLGRRGTSRSGTWLVTTERRRDDRDPVPRRRDRRAVGAVPPRRPRPGRLPRRAAPHRTVAGRAGRRRRQAGRGRSARRRAACRSCRRSLDEVAVAHRLPAHRQLVHAAEQPPITAEEQAELRADFEELREVLNTSIHGFHHPLNPRSAFDDSAEERLAFFEKMWASPGFMKFTSNYVDILDQPRGERGVVRVHRRQDPRHRRRSRRRPSA